MIKKVVDVPLTPGLEWTFLVKGRRILVLLKQVPAGARPLLARTISIIKALKTASEIERLQRERADHISIADLRLTRGAAKFISIPTEREELLRTAFDHAAYHAILYGADPPR